MVKVYNMGSIDKAETKKINKKKYHTLKAIMERNKRHLRDARYMYLNK